MNLETWGILEKPANDQENIWFNNKISVVPSYEQQVPVVLFWLGHDRLQARFLFRTR